MKTHEEAVKEAMEYGTAITEYGFALTTPEPVTLIQTIDRVREFREVADKEEAGCDYDPQGHTQRMCETLRGAADGLERRMHEKIGWR